MPSIAVASPAALARHARSQRASTSTPRACHPSPHRHRDNEKRISVVTRGGGGHAFDRLVFNQGGAYDAPDYSEAERALDAFWLEQGVREEAYRARLVALGVVDDGESGDDTKNKETSITELYKDPSQLRSSLDHLSTLFPGVNVAEMCWKEPRVLLQDPKLIAKSIITLRFALPKSDVLKILHGQPKLLLSDNAKCAVAAANALQLFFPKTEISAVADVEPSLLTVECDVLGRLERLQNMKSLPKSVGVFVDGEVGSRNAILFAKVFLEETKAWEGVDDFEGQKY